MWLNNHLVVLTLVNLDDFLNGMWQLNASSVNFNAQLLPEINFNISHFEGDSFRPAGMFCLTRIICHSNWKRVIYAVGSQLIFARTLKAKKLSVECLVVWITKHRTHAGTFDAFGTALAFGNDAIFVGSTFYNWTLGLSTTDFTRATFAWLTWAEIPCFEVLWASMTLLMIEMKRVERCRRTTA